MKDLTSVQADLNAFLASLKDRPDDEMIVNPPGLVGCYRAKEIRHGFQIHALCVHGSGMGLASTYGKNSRAFDHWMDGIMAYNATGEPVNPERLREYMLRVGRAFLKRSDPSPVADPWSMPL